MKWLRGVLSRRRAHGGRIPQTKPQGVPVRLSEGLAVVPDGSEKFWRKFFPNAEILTYSQVRAMEEAHDED